MFCMTLSAESDTSVHPPHPPLLHSPPSTPPTSAFSLEYYTEVLDLSLLLDHLSDDPLFARYRHLNEALVGLVEDYSLVSFCTLNVQVSSWWTAGGQLVGSWWAVGLGNWWAAGGRVLLMYHEMCHVSCLLCVLLPCHCTGYTILRAHLTSVHLVSVLVLPNPPLPPSPLSSSLARTRRA